MCGGSAPKPPKVEPTPAPTTPEPTPVAPQPADTPSDKMKKAKKGKSSLRIDINTGNAAASGGVGVSVANG